VKTACTVLYCSDICIRTQNNKHNTRSKTCTYQWQSQTGPGPIDSWQKFPQSINNWWDDVASREQASVTCGTCIASRGRVWRQSACKLIQTWPVKHIYTSSQMTVSLALGLYKACPLLEWNRIITTDITYILLIK